jgi:hypothetical protein
MLEDRVTLTTVLEEAGVADTAFSSSVAMTA